MTAYPQAKPDQYGENLTLHDKRHGRIALNDRMTQCKIWPAHPELAIIVVKTDIEFDPEISGEATNADLELFITSVKNKRILAHYTKAGALSSDAFYVSQIKLDTARYQLNPATTAFGVRVTRNGSSSVYPFNTEVLNLYTYRQHQITKVMDNLQTKSYSGVNEGQCNSEFSTEKSIILIGKETHQSGFASLTVKTTRQDFADTMDEGACVQTKQKTQKDKHVIHFSHGAYQVPKNISGL
ncbi:hypothetical protein [Vibrio quintilis]|nr:hypothetical protein [Vibrio quintilis]